MFKNIEKSSRFYDISYINNSLKYFTIFSIYCKGFHDVKSFII